MKRVLILLAFVCCTEVVLAADREMTSKSMPMTSRWEYTLEPTSEGCKLTIDGETYIRSGTWHVPILRVMMVLAGGVKKGLDIQMDMVAETLGVEAQRE